MTITLAAVSLLLWLMGFIMLWRIPYCRGSRPDVFPGISIIIPARNEEKTLPRLLASLKVQSVEADEIIVVDDSSADGTAEIARRSGVRLIQPGPLPEGWLGKPWACWQGAKEASSEIIVFLDADTMLEQDGLSRIVTTFQQAGGLLSVWPYQVMARLSDRLSAFFHLIVMASMNVFTPLGETLRPLGAFGPCVVCRRRDYLSIEGHQRVRDSVLEDIALGTAFLDSGHCVHCYGGKRTLRSGQSGGIGSLSGSFQKNLASGAGTVSPFILCLIVGWISGCFIVSTMLIATLLVMGPRPATLWAIIDSLYVLQIAWLLHAIGNFGLLTAMLYQIPLIFFTVIFIRSLISTLLFGRVAWKGREITLRK